ncbi:transporter substrate-binding domain-containing protein [Albidovulum sp.]|uniref:transporter substrate-binding domain-containing protein n=1 Tax=Albidovulum sp. TaxID=1872424 RepID=UPI0039B8DFDF
MTRIQNGRFFVGAITAGLMALGAAVPASAEQYEPDAAAVALVPAKIREAGTLRVAMPDQGKPFNYQDGDEIKGMEPDMARAIAETLGLTPQITLVPFTAALPGLQSDKFDVSFGQFYIRPERLEVVDFVTDWSTYTVFLTLEEKGLNPTKVPDLCGLSVGAMQGTIQYDNLEKNADKCDSGKIDVHAFPSMANAVLALKSGRVDVVFVDPDISREARKVDASLKESGKLNRGILGIAISRDEKASGLANAIQAALVHLNETDDYKKILDEHETGYGAITDFEIYDQNSTPPTYN